jgi:ubiquinone/menaquinone biosynthesis C-methylase UbiE
MSGLDARQEASRRQFERQSDRYGKGHLLADVSDLGRALAPVAPRAGQRALDVATGGGHTGAHLASLGLEVTVSDISAAMLANAVKLAAERGLSVAPRQHPAESMPYPDAAFDLVTCRVAAHHFSSPSGFVKEVARVLRPGGAFVLVDGTVPDGEVEAEEWLHRVEKLRDPSHGRFLTPGQWGEFCRAAGLEVRSRTVEEREQPDLERYFEIAATPDENRRRVRELVARAPASARRLFRIVERDGKVTWQWTMLLLAAVKG